MAKKHNCSTLTLLYYITFASIMLAGCSNDTNSNKNTIPKKTLHYFTQDNTKKAFTHQVYGLNNKEIDRFILGKSFFRIPWVEAPAATTARDGLGPLFNANTCVHCHPNNGAGVAVNEKGEMNRSYLLRLSHKNPKNDERILKNGFEPDSTYGAQLSINGNLNVPSEGQVEVKYESIHGLYPDGTRFSLRKPHYTLTNMNYGALDEDTVIAPRIGSALIGLGLLESISEKDILVYQDSEDKNNDGISGKANYAYNPETNQTELGRFTWKASATTVKHQSAGAAHNDMGLSNPLFPNHNCTDKQVACQNEANKVKHTLDLPAERLDAITYYLTHLAIPKQREPKKHLEGAKLFASIGCTACHVSSYKTTKGVTIQPYSDLLLHDMGKGLEDGRSEFLATGVEWRTAPLWGIGLYAKVSGEANYLHDGRARSIEEAILWHGGEAEKSKLEFMALDKIPREKVLLFLNSI